MPRYVIRLSYDGGRFNGWQKQPEVNTIQGTVEQAIRTITQEKVTLYGSGRTDTGVHAEQQFAHFDTVIPIDEQFLLHRLQRMLPDDIFVYGIREVAEHFHARFDAKWRQYRYQLLLHPDPFHRQYAWYPGSNLDWESFAECLMLIEGEHDFSGFCRKGDNITHCRCTVLYTKLEQHEDSMVLVYIRANRFLRSMIRTLTGAMVTVGIGKKNTEWFCNHLHEGEEIDNIAIAPSKGLFLEKVFYPKDDLDLT